MELGSRFSRRHVLFLCAFLVTAVLSMQLVAATAWTADDANRGPGVVILQLSGDEDTDWAVADLQGRLSEFITDDPFFVDRVVVRKTSDPHVAETLEAQIVVYMSHGGPLGLVTGSHLTSWRMMAQIVAGSKAIMHLFAACYSRNLIRYGDEESGKQLYTVTGARPAEVTNVEVVSTIMLALGQDAVSVEEYRTSELTKAKNSIDADEKIHIMDYEQVILDEIESIDDDYSDSYTDTHQVYRFSVVETISGLGGFSTLPLDLQSTIVAYYRAYISTYGEPCLRVLEELSVTYTKDYYYEATWVLDIEEPPDDPDPPTDPERPMNPGVPIPDIGDPLLLSFTYMRTAAAANGHWEYGPNIFAGGTYSGLVIYSGDGCDFLQVVIDVTASGSTLDATGKTNLESISLKQIDARGIYVQKQKVDGVWQEPITGRNPGRTGGTFTDPCQNADYEYDSSWPNVPGATSSSGTLTSAGEYLTVTGIPTGSSWHGPSFVRTLPAYFKLKDLGTLSANLSIVHHGSITPLSFTAVCLYDVNKKIVAAVILVDYWPDLQDAVYQIRYYKADGTTYSVQSPHFTGDTNGVVQIRYDPLRGIFGDAPGISDTCLLYRNQMGSEGERLIKYLVIQSCRYGSNAEQDERIYSIDLSYAGSENSVFHDDCNNTDSFSKDLTFPYGTPSEGVLSVPTGQSYMKWTSIVTGSGWHGPQYVHVLDKPFRLYQLSEFSVIGQLIQSSSTMGGAYVGLFDENKQCVLLIHWADAWVGSQKGYFNTYFYSQDGGSYYQQSGYIYTSFMKTGKLWWGEGFGGDGAIYSSIDGSGSLYPIGECDNASRVIKYVVTLGYRADSYLLVDMRIHDINVIADLNRHDPNAPTVPPPSQDPPAGETQPTVEYDGTTEGVTENSQKRFNSKIDQEMSGAAFSVEAYWTGWWPECHVAVHKEINPDVSCDIQMKVDLIGSFAIEETRMKFYGIEDMTEEEAEDTAQEVSDATVGVINAALAVLSFAYIAAWLAVTFAAMTVTFVTEGIFWALLGIALVVTVGYFATMIWALLETGSPWWIAALAFLGLAFQSLAASSGAKSAAGKIASEFKFIGKIGDLFSWVFDSPLGDIFKAAQHRSHWALQIARMVVFVVALSISTLLWIGVLQGM